MVSLVHKPKSLVNRERFYDRHPNKVQDDRPCDSVVEFLYNKDALIAAFRHCESLMRRPCQPVFTLAEIESEIQDLPVIGLIIKP